MNHNGHMKLSELNIEQDSLFGVLTPALAIYPDIVDSNIRATLNLVGGDSRRWQPHMKTAKLARTLRQFLAHGVDMVKCSTTLELFVACQEGVAEALLAYPCSGNQLRRVAEIAVMFPSVKVTGIVESPLQVSEWIGIGSGLYIDVNPGMDRTGIDQARVDKICILAQTIVSAGIALRGIHYYDGQNSQSDVDTRMRNSFSGYQKLVALVECLREQGIGIETLVTSGTPTLPCALSFPAFRKQMFNHRISSGTLVYGDLTSLSQLPTSYGYRLAAVVVATVISHPIPGVVTCDAGLKSVSADAGIPSCEVIGHPELEPLKPSEEHLPMRVKEGSTIPEIGTILYLAPRHICTTVNNFDNAIIVQNGKVVELACVSARGRECPLMR
jgi:D-serine deaminase-like pyridoxal phosphate-dependent protein